MKTRSVAGYREDVTLKRARQHDDRDKLLGQLAHEIFWSGYLYDECQRLKKQCLTMWAKENQWTVEQITAIQALMNKGNLFDPFEDWDEPCLLLNMNDVWSWASADAEEITADEAVEIHKLAEAIGYDYCEILWVANKHNMEPQKPILDRPEYQKAKKRYEDYKAKNGN